MRKFVQALVRAQKGITGLETAIILIAFVVVASVFAYTVLSAGIFSAEKGKEAIHAGLDTARSSMSIVGAVVAEDTDSDNDIDTIIFTVANALNGKAIDLTTTSDLDGDGLWSDENTISHTTIISYYDSIQRIDDIPWSTTKVGRGDGDVLLEANEKFIITVTLTTALSTPLKEYTTFTIEVKPAVGAALIFERTTPGVIDDVMDLR